MKNNFKTAYILPLIVIFLICTQGSSAQKSYMNRNDGASRENLKHSVYVAANSYTSNTTKNYGVTFALDALLREIERGAKFTPPQIHLYLQTSAEEYARGLTQAKDGTQTKDDVRLGVSAASKAARILFPPVNASVSALADSYSIQQSLEEKLTNYIDQYWAPERENIDLLNRNAYSSLIRNMPQLAEDSFSRLSKLYNSKDLTPETRQQLEAIDQRLAFEGFSSVRSNADQILQENPNFSESKAVSDILKKLPSLMTKQDFALLKKEMMKEFEKINETSSTLLKVELEVLNKMNQKEQAEEEREVQKAKLEAAYGGIILLSGIIGFADPEAARAISVTGNATIQIAESFIKYNDAISNAGKVGDFAKNFGTLALTANILGAVQSIFSLFGPSMDEIILEQITKLREELQQVRKEMHARFDIVDAKLNLIYSEMIYRMEIIETRLGDIQAAQQETNFGIFVINEKIDDLEVRQNIDRRQKTREEQIRISNACAPENRSTADRPLTLKEYKTCLQRIVDVVTIDAHQPVWNGQHLTNEVDLKKNREFALSDYLNFTPENFIESIISLDQGQFSKNNSHSTFSNEKNKSPDVPQGFPNPLLWSWAAREYTKLAIAYPTFLRLISTNSSNDKQKQTYGFNSLLNRGENLTSKLIHLGSTNIEGNIGMYTGRLAQLIDDYSNDLKKIDLASGYDFGEILDKYADGKKQTYAAAYRINNKGESPKSNAVRVIPKVSYSDKLIGSNGVDDFAKTLEVPSVNILLRGHTPQDNAEWAFKKDFAEVNLGDQPELQKLIKEAIGPAFTTAVALGTANVQLTMEASCTPPNLKHIENFEGNLPTGLLQKLTEGRIKIGTLIEHKQLREFAVTKMEYRPPHSTDSRGSSGAGYYPRTMIPNTPVYSIQAPMMLSFRIEVVPIDINSKAYKSDAFNKPSPGADIYLEENIEGKPRLGFIPYTNGLRANLVSSSLHDCGNWGKDPASKRWALQSTNTDSLAYLKDNLDKGENLLEEFLAGIQTAKKFKNQRISKTYNFQKQVLTLAKAVSTAHESFRKEQETELDTFWNYTNAMKKPINPKQSTSHEELTASKRLLHSVIALTLPDVYETDDYVRSRLTGSVNGCDSVALPDEAWLQAYEAANCAPNQIARAKENISEFKTYLLETLPKNAHFPQELPYLRNGINQLRLVKDFARKLNPSPYTVGEAFSNLRADLKSLGL